jgi:hypothetical protein
MARWRIGRRVLFHTIVHLWHSTTHFQIPVPLTAAQIALVVVVVLVLPLLGAGLLWTTQKREAAWLITVSMLVSLLFGFISHFVLSGSSDDVLAVPAGVRCQPQRPTVATKGGS